ncbi:pro-kumamolisin, activation domain-containing protein [Trichoderma breve]|uniref:Pro-kumamolisin, activation domain-containing protein n=1 Tax=Trichoderma breve TaxID=2034170 RepID=A0A9W9BEU4_9HYPO|nr:pro-kumamolisin, activation domain-containing protein [Trichoderma breve]KAJ4860049.1 pro-kumamolisin, activation domain-containing protein [Trichoderma breve]
MRFSSAIQVAALVGLTSGRSIPENHVVHEKRGVPNPKLHKRVSPDVVLPVRVGLKQNVKAMEQAEDWLAEISHPSSSLYGKHWTLDEVVEAFKPSDDAVETVAAWLIKSGISKERITHSDNKVWLAFDATAAEVENLLNTKYFHDDRDRALVATHEYHLPEHVSEHVDYITPGVKVAPQFKFNPHRRQQQIRPFPKLPKKSTPDDLSTCDQTITPKCLQALYNFEAPDPHAKPDFNAFFAEYTPYIPNGTHPTLDSIDGAKAPVSQGNAGGESNLDFELAYPIIYPQTTTLFQTDDAFYAQQFTGVFNTFFDALDGSYCTYSAFGETGNDPTLDPPTNVISISYGVQESDLPANYQKRQCQEFLKLALQGVSVFVASGDTGVGGYPGDTDADFYGCLRDDDVFSPTHPNSCPWLTNVGATKVYPGKTVHDPESAVFDPSPSFNYSSGGGFSNIYPIPKYQQSAVANYFKKYNPSYPYYENGQYQNSTGIYNRNGRGIPDVAANGDNIAVWVQGQKGLSGGTSASAPIFASLINRIVEERIKIGKGPLGLINSVLYENPGVLNDITNGTNPGCGTLGFNATKGWDPVTGLGTPNYPKMLELFLSLP